jgi:hypothetical protein
MLYDNIFQLIKEIFLTLVWYVCSRTKEVCIDLYDFFAERLFHRAHRFNFSEVLGHDGENARCVICDKRLVELKTARIPVTRALGIALAVVCLITAIARADNFVNAKADSIFLRDSVYVLKVAVTQSTCDEMSICTLQIAGNGGGGAVFKNLHGNIGDTIEVPYNFPASQFGTGVSRATLYFFGSDGKAKDIWMIKLGYKDPNPSSVGFRRRAPGLNRLGVAWNGLVNGRNFK